MIPPPIRMKVNKYGSNGEPLSPGSDAFAAVAGAVPSVRSAPGAVGIAPGVWADARTGATQRAAATAAVASADRTAFEINMHSYFRASSQ